MKRIFTTIILLVLTLNVFAQAPEKMSYQAVIRDASDELLASQQIGVKISILQGSDVTTAAAVYEETHTPSTNSNGLISLEIGSGTSVSGNFGSIDWSSGTCFIKTETDPAGGANYSITGTSQLLSVPYSLYAKKAAILTGDQANNIDTNTAKIGITTAQSDAITANTAKVGVPTGGSGGQVLKTDGSGTHTWVDQTSGTDDQTGTEVNLTSVLDVDDDQIDETTVEEAIIALANKLVPAGTIIMSGAQSAPTGYLLCDGTSVSRTTYSSLFTAIGTAYGAADSNSFNLPDMRGRFARGVDGGEGNDSDAGSRTVSNTGGNTGDNVGSLQDDATARPNSNFTTDTNTLTHDHGVTDGGHSHTVTNSEGAHFWIYHGSTLRVPSSGETYPATNTTSTYLTASSATTGISINDAAPTHSHNITSGGDNETRPKNVNVNYFIKY